MIQPVFVRDLTGRRNTVTQKLWRLPVPYRNDETGWTVTHVVTSATVVLGTPETYVFAADSEGKIVDWGELPGSFRGALDHEEAIRGFAASELGSEVDGDG